MTGYTGKTMLSPTQAASTPPGLRLQDWLGSVTSGEAMPEVKLAPNPPSEANPKHAFGLSKPRLDLVPSSAIILEALVFEIGAKKYGPFNWRETDVVRSIYLAAAYRHIMALLDGQDLDEESGLPHEAHVRACMSIIIDARALGKLIDDRHAAGPAPEMLKQYTKPRPIEGAR